MTAPPSDADILDRAADRLEKPDSYREPAGKAKPLPGYIHLPLSVRCEDCGDVQPAHATVTRTQCGSHYHHWGFGDIVLPAGWHMLDAWHDYAMRLSVRCARCEAAR